MLRFQPLTVDYFGWDVTEIATVDFAGACLASHFFFCDFGDVCAFTHIPNYPAARFVEFFALACWNLELISGQLGISLQ